MTPPDPQQVAAIAGRLSKAQREAVLGAWKREFPGYVSGDRWECRDANRVAAALYSKGLAYPALPVSWRSKKRVVCLTPLGLAVRNFIQGNSHD